ncbi:TonB-dependent receptor [Catenovulum sp. SM1970]|uniref:TonB-dependent receptor plug domain-containing protein n=1 Tax=Marinifaba aquimaris TaxID=2741323 RepID=UPI0015734EE2|nr:TonB-dependent receptor [Marinifaba aquimaris]NTS78527.1 TonB-dependent receptor [Marinifaba aquimaris]
MRYTSFSMLTGLLVSSFAQANELEDISIDNLQAMSLGELLELEVITPSRTKQKLIDAPANITVINQVQIQQRGYSNLVQVLEDVPGFDFATYQDGGGEYPTHSSARGIGGDPGNPKLLILLDGIIQNHIAFNWSQLWGEENIFADLERIEIIQGPGSAIYGANAFSGVVHFITKRYVKEPNTKVDVKLADNSTQSLTVTHQSLYKDFHLNAALKTYSSDGDMGKDRFDPAGYFSSHPWPVWLEENYDENNQYQKNVVNPYAGQYLDAGFNTEQNHWAIRVNASYFSPEEESKLAGISKISFGFHLWDQESGLASYVPSYEYQATADNFKSHHSGKHAYLDLDYRLSSDLKTKTRAWYRENRQLPDTGFRYSYRFVDLTKSYHSFNSQIGIEPQLEWQRDKDSTLLVGMRLMQSDKMDQLVSLGAEQLGHDPVTDSSWHRATEGDNPQLGLPEREPVNKVSEQALYSTYDSVLADNWNYSLGLRYDNSDDYGDTLNPRLGFIYKVPVELFERLNVKFLYGEAFREPSVFELTDEFRGNENLEPEEISTYEVVSQGSWIAENNDAWIQALTFSASVYYSDLQNLISLVANPGSESGVIYSNTDDTQVRGATLSSDLQLGRNLKSYINYHFNECDAGDGWKDIPNVATHKINAGINYQTEWANFDLRVNYVGEREVPDTNSYFAHEKAPSYTKVNAVVTSRSFNYAGFELQPQLKINNLLDEDYYGVGRQDGRSLVTDYDPITNPNPEGFAPAYHPQSGRTLEFNLSVKF